MQFSPHIPFRNFTFDNVSLFSMSLLLLLNVEHTLNITFQTSEIESDDHCQKEQELQKENLKLSSENIELKFQLEQANKDLPRLKVNLTLL